MSKTTKHDREILRVLKQLPSADGDEEQARKHARGGRYWSGLARELARRLAARSGGAATAAEASEDNGNVG